jgi:hypothetical protein
MTGSVGAVGVGMVGCPPIPVSSAGVPGFCAFGSINIHLLKLVYKTFFRTPFGVEEGH